MGYGCQSEIAGHDQRIQLEAKNIAEVGDQAIGAVGKKRSRGVTLPILAFDAQERQFPVRKVNHQPHRGQGGEEGDPGEAHDAVAGEQDGKDEHRPQNEGQKIETAGQVKTKVCFE